MCAIALFFYAYWIAADTNRSTQHTEESIARGEVLSHHLTDMEMGVRGYLFTQKTSFLAPYQSGSAQVVSDLSSLRKLESDEPAHVEQIDQLQSEINRWLSEWVIPTMDKISRSEPIDTQAVVAEGQRRFDSIQAKLGKLLDDDRDKDLNKRHQAENGLRRMLFLGLGITLLLGGVLFSLTRAVTRIIVEPLTQLIEASERVGRGDLQPSLPPATPNDFGVLSESFSRMTAALREEREEMAALNSFSEAVAQCTTEGEVYDHVLHALKDRFHPRQGIIFKLHSTENFLEAAASLVPLPEELRAWPVIEEPHNCKAVRLGRCFRANDVTTEPLCPASFVPPQEGSYYCGPLIAGGIIIGAVRLEGAKGFWTPERERLLESYLGGAASALSNLRLLETMKHQANVDVLTGLYNRRFLEDYARKLIPMARRRNQPLGVIMMDLDHFKSFNDVYGHEVGDRILRQFAKTISAAMRETNLAARFGGEEFVVLLPDTGAKACLLVAERIRQAVARMLVPPGTERHLQLTISLGIAIYPDHGQTLEEVLHACDKALYESKRAGRNRATLFQEQPEPGEEAKTTFHG